MVKPETRASRISRLRRALKPLTNKAPSPGVVAYEAEYLELVEVFADPAVGLEELLDYAQGRSWVVARAALEALSVRQEDGPAALALVLGHLTQFHVFAVGPALRLLGRLLPDGEAGRPLFRYARDSSLSPYGVRKRCLERAFEGFFEELRLRNRELRAEDVTPDELNESDRSDLRGFLPRVRHPLASMLAGTLETAPGTKEGAPTAPPRVQPPAPPSSPVEPSFFERVGQFWSDRDIAQPIAVSAWAERLATGQSTLRSDPPRSLLVVGDALAGKSSFLKLLGRMVTADGWRVFEADATDFLADNIYIGQTEGLVRQARQALAASNKIVWYVPDLVRLAQSGSHKHNAATILDQLMPSVATGQLVLWGEATPQAAERLLRLKPALRQCLESIRLEPLSPAETQPLANDLVRSLGREKSIRVGPSLAAEAIEAAGRYALAASLPGAALSLIRDAVQRATRSGDSHVTRSHLLGAMSDATGLPRALLDGSEHLELGRLTEFFSSRVIGQPEAVRSVVDRIAMLKAGLNDPKKPVGVFFFAGPTGTGKTELGKAAAEYLFGSPERLVRLDMSEYRAEDSLPKLIGGPYIPERAETLIDRVRRQPYSVLLFDEFEKSHPYVWDLCLQLLDEGRLTDYNGQTADFRNCLIILTSNLGATSHQARGLGFAAVQSAYGDQQVMAAIRDAFRPEFLNRLDTVVVFKPLTRELMRGILKKELGRLFERRGLRQRDWAIEWEASAIEFLLEKGFDAEMGARPLKRAIDQYVAVPLATAIVERRAPEQEQFVFMRSDGMAIQAVFVDPDADVPPAVAVIDRTAPVAIDQLSLPAIALTPAGSRVEIEAMAAALAEIEARLATPAWADEKEALARQLNSPAFWERPDRFAVLTRFEVMDRLEVAVDTAASLHARLARPRGGLGAAARDVVARLAVQVMLVQEGLRDCDEAAPVEVALAIEPALGGRPVEDSLVAQWSGELSKMYCAWCRKRQVLLSEAALASSGFAAVHLISGFGAHRTLIREAGLHLLESQDAAGATVRLVARVVVVPTPTGGTPESRAASLADALARAPRAAAVVRRYRREPSPLVRGGEGTWRSGKLDAVLGGDFDLVERVSS